MPHLLLQLPAEMSVSSQDNSIQGNSFRRASCPKIILCLLWCSGFYLEINLYTGHNCFSSKFLMHALSVKMFVAVLVQIISLSHSLCVLNYIAYAANNTLEKEASSTILIQLS